MNWRKLLWNFTGLIQFGFLILWVIFAIIMITGFTMKEFRPIPLFFVPFALWFFFRKIRKPFKGRYRMGGTVDTGKALKNYFIGKSIFGSFTNTEEDKIKEASFRDDFTGGKNGFIG
jgi:hypothetical protein